MYPLVCMCRQALPNRALELGGGGKVGGVGVTDYLNNAL